MANDIAKALEYSDCPEAIRTHCKGVAEMSTPTAGGVQKVKFIPEGDIYRLITHSKLMSAERFEKWVFDEVLGYQNGSRDINRHADVEKTGEVSTEACLIEVVC